MPMMVTEGVEPQEEGRKQNACWGVHSRRAVEVSGVRAHCGGGRGSHRAREEGDGACRWSHPRQGRGACELGSQEYAGVEEVPTPPPPRRSFSPAAKRRQRALSRR